MEQRLILVYTVCLEINTGSAQLRIDKGSPGGALYLGTCIHNYGSCNGISYIE